MEATSAKFNIIAAHIKDDFICAGFFPAAIVASVWSSYDENKDVGRLIYNDIDVYHGKFADGMIQRMGCSWKKLQGIEKDINFVSCVNLNIAALKDNCDINAVAVFVHVKVNEKKVSSVKWDVAPQFWHFLFFEHILKSYQTDSPARTLVRLAYKSFQMGLPFDQGTLSPMDGDLFSSHKRKFEEMEESWDKFPLKRYRIKEKSGKSFVLRKSYVNCSCGRKANLNCVLELCLKCCLKKPNNCKAHKNKKK